MLKKIKIDSKAKKVIIADVVLFLIYVGAVYNLFFEDVIRFSSIHLNYLFILVILSIPFWILLSGFVQKKIWIRVSLLLGMLLPLAFSTILGFFTLFDYIDILKTGRDSAFEQISEVEGDGYSVCLYRTNYGATTPFGLVLMQEKKILPGLLLVKRVWSERGRKATIEKIGENRFMIFLPPYENQRKPGEAEVAIVVKPNVYW